MFFKLKKDYVLYTSMKLDVISTEHGSSNKEAGIFIGVNRDLKSVEFP